MKISLPPFGAIGPFMCCLIFVFLSCKSDSKVTSNTYNFLAGETMGTTYHIKLDAPDYLNYQYEIDSVLTTVNQSMSTYIPSSVISRFNLTDTPFVMQKNKQQPILNATLFYFYENFLKAKEIWKLSHGAFDPTIGPIVNYWGFGSDGLKEISNADTAYINELLGSVGMQHVELQEQIARFVITKKKPGLKLDFNALAKGYGVDKVSELLDERGVENYMVEIGGEARTKGVNPSKKFWSIGINTPDTDAALNDFFAIVKLENKAMATSGNYRNYYEIDGQKRFHSINPKTGFPEANSMRSASIIANDCMTADALATTCMILGVQKAKSLMHMLDNVAAFLVYEGENGENQYFATPGLTFELVKQE